MLFICGGSLGMLIVTESAAVVPGYRTLAADAAELLAVEAAEPPPFALLPHPAREAVSTAASSRDVMRQTCLFWLLPLRI